MDKIKYVAGLYFSENKKEVALIRKNRPTWQSGKLNAIGGKIEFGESSHEAMVREFKEETGVQCERWRLFCIFTGKEFEVYFFTSFASLGKLDDLTSITDEKIEIWKLEDLINYEHKISNLNWLIPMAIDKDQIFSVVKETI